MKIFQWKHPIFFLALILAMSAISCSKQSSSNSNIPPPPPPPPPPGQVTKYVKTEVATFTTNSSNLDSFVYDSQHRLTQYTLTVISSSSSLNMYFEYNMSYTGNNTMPDSYTIKTKQAYPDTIIVTNILKYNSSNQLIQDSTISCSLPSYSENRTRNYEYGSNLMIVKTNYADASIPNKLDSAFLDNNGNEIKRVYRQWDQISDFAVSQIKTSTFGATPDPFYNTSFHIILGIINANGATGNKNLETSSTYTNYNNGSVSETHNDAYQYTLDGNGYILKVTVAFDGANYLTVDYNYY